MVKELMLERLKCYSINGRQDGESRRPIENYHTLQLPVLVLPVGKW